MVTKKTKAKAKKKTSKKVAETPVTISETALAIRTSTAQLTSHSGFQWPQEGEVVCPDWNPIAACGNGLHGLLDGEGDWDLLSRDMDAKWQLVEVNRSECVDLKGKVKFPRCKIVYTGDAATAITLLGVYNIKRLLADPTVTEKASGNYSTAASSGDYSKAASSGNSSTAASSGDYSKAASSGNSSKAASSGYSSKAASSGDYSKAASSGDYSKAASSGDYSTAEAKGKDTIAMVAGLRGRASAGENGCFALPWFDEAAQRNRIIAGYVGEEGIEPEVVYCVDRATGKLVKWQEGMWL